MNSLFKYLIHIWEMHLDAMFVLVCVNRHRSELACALQVSYSWEQVTICTI